MGHCHRAWTCRARSLALIAALGCLPGCGDEESASATPAPPSLAESLGAVDFKCDGQEQQQAQQQELKFRQKSGCSADQVFVFQESVVSDFDVFLDCSRGFVTVVGKGATADRKTFPIQEDGSVKGNLQMQQQVQDDGYGRVQCFVITQVLIDGKARCDFDKSFSYTTQVGFAASSPGVFRSDFASRVDSEELPQLPEEPHPEEPQPEESPSPSPSPRPSPSPSPLESPFPTPSPEDFSPSPTPTPSQSPSPSPSPSLSPSPSPTGTHRPPPPPPRPRPTPRPTVTILPTQVCIVENPCPIEAKADLNCSQ
jgi:hypothetical protein